MFFLQMFKLLLTIHKSRVILIAQGGDSLKFTIKQARVHAGFTQADMAKTLGIDRGTYIKIEKEQSRATVGQINKISQVTGIPMIDIFLGLQLYICR